MSPEGYDAFEDLYCYPGTTVLRNRLDLRDQAELDAFEVEITILRAEAFVGLAQRVFLDRLTPFLSELNAIHPFREGNGRTQLSFLGVLGEHCAHPFHFEKLNRETYLPAVISGYLGNLQPLRDELRKLLT